MRFNNYDESPMHSVKMFYSTVHKVSREIRTTTSFCEIQYLGQREYLALVANYYGTYYSEDCADSINYDNETDKMWIRGHVGDYIDYEITVEPI